MTELRCTCGEVKHDLKMIAKNPEVGYDLVTACSACGEEYLQQVFLPDQLKILKANGKESAVNVSPYKAVINLQFK